jgi:hypothetical protein
MAKFTILDTTWELWRYDVWGNKKDGYEVNDRNCFNRDYPIKLKIEVNNLGSQHEFFSAYPSDYQIKKAFGVNCKIDTSGDDTSIYIERASDGYPLGEMFCTSNKSLSPINDHYIYTFWNERDNFYANVDDKDGNTVFKFNNEVEEMDEDGVKHIYNGELWITNDGFMKHIEDVDGLLKYLIDLAILPRYASLKLVK